ncbi:hypothetical protein DL95DRAFT_157749 [Leptodontidium sp. 2 PMI_412]|nr:hypothetical protein DL95DRAFT_157749 [Leptodontidium sp. 2 PMI_412]
MMACIHAWDDTKTVFLYKRITSSLHLSSFPSLTIHSHQQKTKGERVYFPIPGSQIPKPSTRNPKVSSLSPSNAPFPSRFSLLPIKVHTSHMKSYLASPPLPFLLIVSRKRKRLYCDPGPTIPGPGHK